MKIGGFSIEKEGIFYKISYDGCSNENNVLDIIDFMVRFPNFYVIYFISQDGEDMDDRPIFFEGFTIADEDFSCTLIECDEFTSGEFGMRDLFQRFAILLHKRKLDKTFLNMLPFEVLVNGEIDVDKLREEF